MIEVKGQQRPGRILRRPGRHHHPQGPPCTLQHWEGREAAAHQSDRRSPVEARRMGMEWFHPVHGTRRQQADYARRQRREQRDVHQEADA